MYRFGGVGIERFTDGDDLHQRQAAVELARDIGDRIVTRPVEPPLRGVWRERPHDHDAAARIGSASCSAAGSETDISRNTTGLLTT